MTRVLIADDDLLVAHGLALLIGAAADLEVAAIHDSGSEAVFRAQCLRPEVAVIGTHLDAAEAVTATRLLLGGHPAPRVVIVSAAEDDESVLRCLRAGASGYVLKRTAPTDLVAAVRHVASGHAWLDPHVAAAVIGALAPRSWAGRGLPRSCDILTPRELEVLLLMADGLSNAEIGERLVISEGTVKTHVSRVLMKLAARDRAQAIARAYRSGWVPLAS